MEKSRPWWDYSDDEDSDEQFQNQSTTASKTSESLSLPYYLKFINFPYNATQVEIMEFLGLNSPTTNLKLLYSRCKKKRFRGIAIYRVDNQEIGRILMSKQGQIFKERQILVDIEIEWEDKVPVFQQKPKRGKLPVTSATKYRKGYRKSFKQQFQNFLKGILN